MGGIIIGRNPRVEYAGACYHVIQRGNNQEEIFQQDIYKRFFIETLQITAKKHNCLIFGYVIMNNHYHLLLQTLNKPLNKMTHRLNGRFAQFYNWRNNRRGHVFQDRCKAFLVLDERYLLTVLRYIHQNPVRAQITLHVSDYRWSSDYFYRNQKSGWVDTGFILNLLSGDPESAAAHYRELMGEPVADEEKAALYRDKKQVQVLEHVELNIESAASLSKDWKPQHHALQQNMSNLDTLLQQCCSGEIEFNMIKTGSRLRELRNTKQAYVKMSREAGYTFEEIGANISLTKSAIMYMVKNNIT